MKGTAPLLVAALAATCWLESRVAMPAHAQILYQTQTVYFYDEGDQLTQADQDAIVQMLEDASEETEMHIGVWLGSTPMGESATISMCDETYDDAFATDSDGIFLYLDLSGEDDLFDYISASGVGQLIYTETEEYNRVGEIFSQMNPHLQRGAEDPAAAIRVFCDQLIYYAQEGPPADDYYIYNDHKDQYLIYQDGEGQWVDQLPASYRHLLSPVAAALIAVAVGLLAGVICLLVIWRCYRFRTPEHASRYPQNQEVEFTHRQDQFLRQYRTRVKIDTDSGSGGGSSRTSSSGGSHTGGGNHR